MVLCRETQYHALKEVPLTTIAKLVLKLTLTAVAVVQLPVAEAKS